MSVPRVIEMVFPADQFAAPPAPGSFFASASGLTALAVSKVRRVVAEREPVRYRLIGLRVRLCDMPEGVTLLPWPKRLPKPSRAATGSLAGRTAPLRGNAAQERVEARRRVVGLLRDDRDSNRVVHKVRIDNATVQTSDWRDPDDTNPNRRTARVVHGFRARDAVQNLLDNSTITKGHAHAARRFRKEYELGEIGLRPSRNLAETPSGFASGVGPSEARMRSLETYQATAKALMPHLLDVVLAIVIRDETIMSYAEAHRMNRQAVSGYVLAAFDTLRYVYQERDKTDRERHVETIGARLGPE